MKRHHPIGRLTRRRALMLAGGLGSAPFPAGLGVAVEPIGAGSPAPIMTRPIPGTGEHLPVVGLGTADQWPADLPGPHATLTEIVRTLVAGGGSVVDTASNYGGYGVAETMLGKILAESSLRPRVFIATKIEEHFWVRPEVVQGALRRLAVSKIDLMQMHSVATANQDLAPLRDWKAQGLIRYVGITTSENRYFDAVEAIMRREKPDFVQINYSLRNRQAEQRLLPLAAELGVAVVIDMPFGGAVAPRGNLFSVVRGQTLPDWAGGFDAATWGQFFLKYLLGNAAVTAVIPGTDKPGHMADNLGAGRGRLPDAAQRQQMVRFFEGLA
jgi:aryl-alcohol dehydrogenase-like predicted oxidoreductase